MWPAKDWKIVGAISAWGTVDVCHFGFRAEFAQVVVLSRPPRTTHVKLGAMARAAARYRVSLVDQRNLVEEALCHAARVPASLRPALPIADGLEERLVARAQGGDSTAYQQLLRLFWHDYESVQRHARRAYTAGDGDYGALLHAGLVALFRAIRDYQSGPWSFFVFAEGRIESEIKRAANRTERAIFACRLRSGRHPSLVS